MGLMENDSTITDLSAAGVDQMRLLFESENCLAEIKRILSPQLPHFALSEIRLLPPVEKQEVWAAGVTYLRSKTARMEESDFSANAYDRVYDA